MKNTLFEDLFKKEERIVKSMSDAQIRERIKTLKKIKYQAKFRIIILKLKVWFGI